MKHPKSNKCARLVFYPLQKILNLKKEVKKKKESGPKPMYVWEVNYWVWTRPRLPVESGELGPVCTAGRLTLVVAGPVFTLPTPLFSFFFLLSKVEVFNLLYPTFSIF